MSRDAAIVFIYVLQSCISYATGDDFLVNSSYTDEQRLLEKLMRGYNKDTRPVYNASHPVNIYVGITLTQIFDVDEKNQVLTTNVWLDQEWNDVKLKWDPAEYNGLRIMRIPCRKLWLPDIVLYNSASDYNQKYMEALAMVSHDGGVFWPPIVKFRSSCLMDMTYFPFDDQICTLKIGSWAYDGFQVNVLNRTKTIDLSRFVENGEWELVSATAVRNEVFYTCCPEPFPDVTFKLHIRRRTTYYLYNVIIPSLMLSSLALLGFWMHPDSGEKVTLGLTVLLALSVFMLLIAENTPATSFYIPLLGVYLITAMSFTSLSVISAVMVSNLHNRGSRLVPYCVKSFVLFISKILCIRLHYLTSYTPRMTLPLSHRLSQYSDVKIHNSMNGIVHNCNGETTMINHEGDEGATVEKNSDDNQRYNAILETLKCLMTQQEEHNREASLRGEWQEVAYVLDRLLFCLFLFGMILGSVYLLAVLPMMKTHVT